MKIEGSYQFKAPRERIWEILQDPGIMAQCMPGCEGMEEVGPDEFEATVKVGIAAVKGSYKAKVAIKDRQPPSHYVLSGSGSGGPGFMQGTWSSTWRTTATRAPRCATAPTPRSAASSPAWASACSAAWAR